MGMVPDLSMRFRAKLGIFSLSFRPQPPEEFLFLFPKISAEIAEIPFDLRIFANVLFGLLP